jgi:lipid-A-disaccharide synthase
MTTAAPSPSDQDQSPLIWINAGEASGDMHGAGLMRAMGAACPGARFTGMGGGAMRRAGADVLHDASEISIMGLPAICSALPRLLRLLSTLKAELKRLKPAAVVLIDCPDFNFRLARIAKRLGIPVYYYISPQVWAWRPGRVEFLRENTRRVLCILPFEPDFYRSRGMEVDFVGHPLLDELPLSELDALPVDPDRVAVLPGSRRREVEDLLPRFALACRELMAFRPSLRFSLVRAPGMDRDFLARFWPADPPTGLPTDWVEPGERYPAMRRAALALAASGTVALETGLIGTPTIVAYRLAPLSWFIANRLVKLDFVSLPNLILNREVFPELLQQRATPELMAAHARTWLSDPALAARTRELLAGLRGSLGRHGAPERAAALILGDITRH